MTERLEQSVIDSLRTISDVDFDTYKAFHINPNTKSIYQEYLEVLGSGASTAGLDATSNYANFQKNILLNNPGASRGMNLSSQQLAADKYGADYSIGSEQRLRSEWTQMKMDFAAREDAYLLGGSGQLTAAQQLDIIGTSLQTVGLDGELHPLYTPLSKIQKYDSNLAQNVFEDAVNQDGFINALKGSLSLRGSSLGVSIENLADTIFSGQDQSTAYDDIADIIGWQRNAMSGQSQYLDSISTPDPDEITYTEIADFLLGKTEFTLRQIGDLSEASFQALGQALMGDVSDANQTMMDWAVDLLNDTVEETIGVPIERLKVWSDNLEDSLENFSSEVMAMASGFADKILGSSSASQQFTEVLDFSKSIGLAGLGNDSFGTLKRNISFQYEEGQNVKEYNAYSSTAFLGTFSSLGYDDSVLNGFSSTGWSGIGLSNQSFDDASYDYLGTKYTFFESSDKITINTVPDTTSGNWVDLGSGFYHPNSVVFNMHGKVYNARNHISPLTFDLDGDGIETSHLYDQNVFFDIDADGTAEKVGWIDADDGQLAFDANGDGIINDITELFGDDVMPAFDKLRLFDTNGDGVISALDDDYDNLLVWRDLDQDGFSDAGELFALTDASIQIKEISLAETAMDEYQNENYFSGKSTFTRYDNTTGDMVDVHFLNDNVNTWFMGSQSQVYGTTYEISPEALLLPLSRGYGSLASLHIAMTDNTTLRSIMKDLVNLELSDFDQLSSKMESFLYEWAGVTDNDPDARITGNGSNIDARKVDFIEQFTGVEWKQMGVADLVGSKASVGVKKIWGEIENLMTVRVLVQGTLSDDIFENASYDFMTDSLTLGDTMADLITRGQAYIAGQSVDQTRAFWQSMGNIFIMHSDELGVTIADISSALDTVFGDELFIGEQTITSADGDIYSAIDGSDEVLITNTYVGDDNDNTIMGSNANDYIFGKGGADSLYGLAGDDFLRGDGGGDLHLDGGDGDDRIEGGDGDDTLIGGDGRDDLRGGDGVDTLIGGDGQDKLHGGDGADIIDGGAGADEIDYLESDEAVYVDLRTRTAVGGHAEGDTYQNIENITGSDYSDVLIGDGNNNLINGEKGDDVIHGGDGNDHLFGAEGNDQLFGEKGDDIFSGFEGEEFMDGGEGNDFVVYSHPYNASGVHVDLEAGKGYVGASKGDIYQNIENARGTDYSDILVGDSQGNILEGLEGNDILIGGAGNDILRGGSGSDQLIGGAGADEFVIALHEVGIVRIHDFNPAEDKLNYGTFTTDVISAGSIDIADLGNNDTLLTINGTHQVILEGVLTTDLAPSNFLFAANNNAITDILTYSNVDAGIAMQGDQFDNKLQGTLHADTIYGGDGNDEIFALDGDDTLYGEAGHDYFLSGSGADTIDGGEGSDYVDYRDSHEGITVDLTSGSGQGGTAQGDTFTSIEKIVGSAFDDILIGSNSNNILNGSVGNDMLYAKGGENNELTGGVGDDTFIIDQISGPVLTDTGLSIIADLNLETGQGTLKGGTPTAITYITDFETDNAAEKIDLSGFTITEMYIARIEGVTVNGESTNGAVLQIFNGSENQTILLKNADYSSLNADDFLMPNSFDFSQVQWQVRGDSNNNILLGSTNNDHIFGLGGQDIILGGTGHDIIYTNSGSSTVDAFVISKNTDDQDIIHGFNSYLISEQFWPISEANGAQIGANGTNFINAQAYADGVFDLSQFSNIWNMDDLSISVVGNDTILSLGGGQEIILKEFQHEDITVHASGGATYQGVFGFYAHATTQILRDYNFQFYDGTLNGDEIIGSNDDVLEGGYGVDNIFGYTGNDVLTGAGGNDILNGGSGNDILDGGAGDDTLTGGDHADIYIVGQEAGSTDTITDFQYWRPDEQIDLKDFDAVFTSYDDIFAVSSQQGSDVYIDLGNSQTLVLQDFNLDNLTAGNFVGNAAINNPVVALDDIFTGNEDQQITGNVLSDNGNGQDSDLDGDILSVVAGSVITQAGGAVLLNEDGSFTYTPTQNFSGTDSFSYSLTDGKGSVDTAFVTFNVTTVNDVPTITNQGVTILEDSNIVITTSMLDATDVDNDDNALVFELVTMPLNGTLYLNGTALAIGESFTRQDIVDGLVSLEPSQDYNGVDGFEFIVSDGTNTTSSQTFTINIQSINDAPVAESDNITTNEDTAIIIDVLANDNDIETTSLTIQSVTQGANGSVVINPDGALTYTPNADYHGSDSFVYTMVDADGAEDTANVNVTVNSVNDNPVVIDDTFEGAEDTQITGNVLLNDIDPDGGSLSATAGTYTTAQGGSVILSSNGDFVYTPASDVNGADSFTYTLENNTNSSTGNVTFNLSPVNDEPIAVNNGGETAEDVPLTITSSMLGASDLEQNASELVFTATVLPQNGVLLFDGVALTVNETFTLQNIEDGLLSYSSNADYNGADSFGYTLSDGVTTLTEDTFSMNILPQNDAPIVVNNGVSLDEDSSVVLTTAMLSASDVDNEGAGLTFTLTAAPQNGTLHLNGASMLVNDSFTLQDIESGLVLFEPSHNFNGIAGFEFALSDGVNTLVSETFTVTVNEVNDTPVARPDQFTGTQNEQVMGNVLEDNGNGIDSDPEGDSLSVQAQTIITLNSAIVTILENGDFTYTPASDYSGQDSFQYTLIDEHGATSVASVQIDVQEYINEIHGTSANDRLYGTYDSDAIYGYEGGDRLFGYAADDRLYGGVGDDHFEGQQGDDLIDGGEGKDTAYYWNESGSIHANLETGVISDGYGDTDTLFSIETIYGSRYGDTILGSANNDEIQGYDGNDINLDGRGGDDWIFAGKGNDTVSYTLSENIGASDYYRGDTGIDILRINLTAQEASSTALMAELQSYSNYINLNYDTEVNYGYQHSFQNLGLIVGTFEILEVYVDGILQAQFNNRPILADDNFYLNVDQSTAGNLFTDNGQGSDYDPDGDSFGVTPGTYATTQGGSITVSSNGDFTYTPASSFSGYDRFDYTVTDARGVSSSASANFILNNVIPDIEGTGSNDFRSGSNDDDIIALKGGDDYIWGYDGNDALYGGLGNDYISGGEGDDFIYGGLGIDTMIGDSGADYFVYEAGEIPVYGESDFISDFSVSEGDAIDISSLLLGFVAGSSSITDYIRIDGTSYYKTLQVNIDGVGDDYLDLARIANFDYVGQENQLVLDGNIILSSIPISNLVPEAMDDDIIALAHVSTNGNVLVDNGNGEDIDANGDTLSIQSGTYTTLSGGSVVLSVNGDFVYTPAAGYIGADSFTYMLSDGIGGQDQGTVNLTVVESLQDPIAQDDVFNLAPDRAITVNVLANDIDPTTEGLSVIPQTITTQSGATISLGSDGSLAYTPTTGFTGIETFSYTVTNSLNATSTANVSLIVSDISTVIQGSGSLSGSNQDEIIIRESGDGYIQGFDGDDIIYAGDGNGIILGDGGNDTIYGGAGNTDINGGDGDDTIVAGAGHDRVNGGRGYNILDGGTGIDRVSLANSTYEQTVDLKAGTISDINGITDYLYGIENVLGTYAKDIIIGNDLANELSGSQGENEIYGYGGDDVIYDGDDGSLLFGGDGNDSFRAYGGNDTIVGGAGSDKIYGGLGADTFVFDHTDAKDYVKDFSASEGDVLDISALLTGYDPLQDAISDFISLSESAGDTLLAVDIDGTGTDNISQIVANIEDTSNLNLDDLIVNGTLLVA